MISDLLFGVFNFPKKCKKLPLTIRFFNNFSSDASLESCPDPPLPANETTKMCKCKEELKDKTGPSTPLEESGKFGDFPQDVFNLSQLRTGAILFHIVGILYMFYALALVCDEFFVPSLDVIAEKVRHIF